MENQGQEPKKSLDEVKTFDQLYQLVDSMSLDEFNSQVYMEKDKYDDLNEAIEDFKELVERYRESFKKHILKGKIKSKDILILFPDIVKFVKPACKEKIARLLYEESNSLIARN